MAEAWGSLLRRAKMSSREAAVKLMAEDLEGVEDACAWTVVFACKSVSQTLHTASPSIISPLLSSHLDVSEASQTHTLIRRVLTALIHHCKGPEQFSPVAEILLSKLIDVNKKDNSNGAEPLRRILGIIAVICSVRQGSRLSAKQLATVATQFPSLPLTPSLHNDLLYHATSVLVAGDMSLWMAAGRKIVEHSWGNTTFAMMLAGSLSDLKWGGWKLLELPYVLKKTPDLLVTDTSRTLALLASLHREQRLTDADANWRQKLDRWALSFLAGWTLTAGNPQTLQHVLALSNILPSISPALVTIVEGLLRIEDVKTEHQATSINSTWILGSSLKTLAARKPTTWRDRVDARSWAEVVLAKWSWSELVMDGLVQVLEAIPHVARPLTFEDACKPLTKSLMSHSHSLRTSCLRVLDSNLVQASPAEQQLTKKIIQGEDVPLDVQGVRERILHLNRIQQVVPEGSSQGSELAVRWLVSQLKVSLRPLWSPAGIAVAGLADRCGELVWRLLFDELKGIVNSESVDQLPEWMAGDDEDEVLDEISEEERTWRDPSAHKVRSSVGAWKDESAARTENERIRSQRPKDRFDQQSYELQLLTALGHCASLAERHNRDLIPLFLSLGGPHGPIQLPRAKLSVWLTLLSKFTNPRVLTSTQALHTLYMALLSHPDRSLQTVALSCIFTYKSPHLLPHEDSFRMLLDETKWRDELTNLDLSSLNPDNRNEVVDVLVRLLFGLMLERKGRVRGADRRAAVLTALGGCSEAELDLLVRLMLKPLVPEAMQSDLLGVTIASNVPQKQQLGFLNLLGDVLKNLGSRLVQRWDPLLRATMSIVANAQVSVDAAKADILMEVEDDPVEDETQDVDEPTGTNANPLKSLRASRQLGLKRLADFFRQEVTFDFEPYMTNMFSAFISPRIANLNKESIQTPSALLELFYIWSSREEHALFLVDYDERVLPQVYACLIAPGVKPQVISRVLDIVDRLLALSINHDRVSMRIIKPRVSILLSNLGTLIEHTKQDQAASTPLIAREIHILSGISQYVSDGAQASTLLSLFSPLLRKPNRLVGERTKADLLKIVASLLPLLEDLSDPSSTTYRRTYDLLSASFQSLRSRQARTALVAAFKQLATVDVSLESLADLVDGLNAYSVKRLEEPGFDRRLEAFSSLNQTMYKTFSSTEWLPVLYNMLHSIQDPNELAIRASSSQGLKHFLDAVAANPDSDYQLVFLRKLYPALKNGLRSKNEMVRAEVLGVLAHAISHCENVTSLQDMKVLLADGDEEANFFNNIHHVQLHRRTRALRRLAEHCDANQLRSTTLADIFVPLVSNFIVSASNVDHHLVNSAITATGRMARHLAWGPYFALVNQYIKACKAKDTSERIYVRTLVAVLDNFHFPMGDVVSVDKNEEDGDPDDQEEEEAENVTMAKPAETSRIEDAVNNRLLPALLRHLENRDEAEDTIRIPVSVGIVKVAMHLPDASRETQIRRLLTILSQVFRSKSSETRDLARETLCRIAVILGPSYLSLTIRELRTALVRGPHLHILAYVTHALLVHVTTADNAKVFRVLDDCVADVAHVSAEVVFGEPGKDVQNEGFKTKMKEVRSSSSKGLDSFGIIARFITPSKISGLLLPLRRVMQTTEALKVMQQADDVLRRIAGGLNSNEQLIPSELLVLCHTLVSQNARFLHHVPKPIQKRKGKNAAIVQLKRDDGVIADHYATNSFRFIAFGLDLFNTAFRRGRFDFSDNNVISRLEPMVAVIGNTLYATNSHVLIHGLKATVAIIKCPLKNIAKSVPVFIKQMVAIVRQTGSTESEVVQTALKSLSAVLRDMSSAQIAEKDLLYLLELVGPDLEEPSRQGAVFALLRAVVARQLVVPEVYDLMDRVAEVAVTSQSQNAQEACRGLLLQFLLDYPQGKGRLKTQIAFIAKNTSYSHESGRRSVLELLSAIVTKFDGSLLADHADMLFVALVMVIANDDAPRCREMAAAVVGALLKRLDEDRQRVVVAHLHAWAGQHGQAALTRVAAQMYGLLLDTLQRDAVAHLTGVLDDINAALARSAQALDEDAMDIDGEQAEAEMEWQVPYHALGALDKLLRWFPDVATQASKVVWPTVTPHLLHPHTWVRSAAARALGRLLSCVSATHPRDDFPAPKLDVKDIAGKLCMMLRSEHLDEALSTQVVKNLFWVGKCFAAVPPPAKNGVDHEGGHEGHDMDIEEGEEEGDEEEPQDNRPDNPLAWLFSKLSYQARSAHIVRRNQASTSASDNWHQQPSAILRWFAAMATFLDSSRLIAFLPHILSPVYRISEDDSVRDARMDELKATAIELRELVQQKAGATAFASVYGRIRQRVQEVQRERRAARVNLTAINPHAAAKRRMQRSDTKRDSRKRKNTAFA
ncbi:armadillo-type protein [Amylostereum chailletii]|nr:armadillo-type protein [Amylostereum chailletii]